jgi:hypothetical protein
MLRKIHGTNFFHIKFLDCSNIKCQNGPVLPPAQVFYFNGQALPRFSSSSEELFCRDIKVEYYLKLWGSAFVRSDRFDLRDIIIKY